MLCYRRTGPGVLRFSREVLGKTDGAADKAQHWPQMKNTRQDKHTRSPTQRKGECRYDLANPIVQGVVSQGAQNGILARVQVDPLAMEGWGKGGAPGCSVLGGEAR